MKHFLFSLYLLSVYFSLSFSSLAAHTEVIVYGHCHHCGYGGHYYHPYVYGGYPPPYYYGGPYYGSPYYNPYWGAPVPAPGINVNVHIP